MTSSWQHAVDHMRPARSSVAGGIAGNASHFLDDQLCGKALCDAERNEDGREDPDDRARYSLEVQRISADGEDERDQRAVTDIAHPADRVQCGAGRQNFPERQDERIIEQAECDEPHQQKQRFAASVILRHDFPCGIGDKVQYD